MNTDKPSKPPSNATAPNVAAARSRSKRRTEPMPSGPKEMRERENASGPRVPKSLASGSPGRGVLRPGKR